MMKLRIIFSLLLCGYLHAENLKKELCFGLEYEQRVIEGAQPLVIHILYADPAQVTIKSKHATGRALSRESVSSIVERTDAVAGINGGFFRRGGRFNGNSLRLLKINHKIYSDPQFASGALMWNENEKASVDRVKLNWRLKISGTIYPVDRINQPRRADEAVIYNMFFDETTKTDQKGKEITIDDRLNLDWDKKENLCGEGLLGELSNGNSDLLECVYSVGPSSGITIENIKKELSKGHAHLEYVITSYPDAKSLIDKQYIVGAMPIILKNGTTKTKEEMFEELTSGKKLTPTPDEIIFNPETEGSWLIDGQHPRTAVGIKPDGTWILVVVEGRQPTRSIGMSLCELATFLKSLGCTDAVNLGGGGDSAMVIGDELVNIPSGSSSAGQAGYQQQLERPVSDAICIYQK